MERAKEFFQWYWDCINGKGNPDSIFHVYFVTTIFIVVSLVVLKNINYFKTNKK